LRVRAAERGYLRFQFYFWVVSCALLGAASTVATAGGGIKVTYAVVGLTMGALMGLALGVLHYSIRIGLVTLDIWLIKTLGPIAGHPVGVALSGACLGWLLWHRWAPGNSDSIMGAAIGGLIFALLFAGIGRHTSGRSAKGGKG
jgi:hypothetical protein